MEGAEGSNSLCVGLNGAKGPEKTKEQGERLNLKNADNRGGQRRAVMFCLIMLRIGAKLAISKKKRKRR